MELFEFEGGSPGGSAFRVTNEGGVPGGSRFLRGGSKVFPQRRRIDAGNVTLPWIERGWPGRRCLGLR